MPPEQKVGGSNPLGRTNSFIINYLRRLDFPWFGIDLLLGGKESISKAAAFHVVAINLPLNLPQQFPPLFQLIWPLQSLILSGLAERFAVESLYRRLPAPRSEAEVVVAIHAAMAARNRL